MFEIIIALLVLGLITVPAAIASRHNDPGESIL
jgi:hypothetical protein